MCVCKKMVTKEYPRNGKSKKGHYGRGEYSLQGLTKRNYINKLSKVEKVFKRKGPGDLRQRGTLI